MDKFTNISISKSPVDILFPIITDIRRTDKYEGELIAEGGEEIVKNIDKIIASLDEYKKELIELKAKVSGKLCNV